MTALLPFAAAALLGAAPPPSSKAAPVDTELAELKQQTDEWHQQRLERLKAEDGWLTLVALEWLDEGPNTVGSANDVKLKLPSSAPAHLGTYERHGEEVSFRPAKGAAVTRDGKPFAQGAVKTDAQGGPDVLRSGTLQLLAIKRGDRIGVRVRDSASPVRTRFHGIPRFPVSAQWRKVARWEPAKNGQTLPVQNVLGQMEDTPLAGTATFTHEGQQYRLDAVDEDGALFFVFGDLTNRKESYGAGRFLYADAPKDGQVVLDFNRAYNPPCAFTAFATCPLPPKQNKLLLRVEAGELRAGDH